MSKSKKLKRPNSFGTPVESIRLIKKSVYLIARGRAMNPLNPAEITWCALGTGCVVAPNRLITAAHVINDVVSDEAIKHHQVRDLYYLIRNDDEANWHFQCIMPILDKDLFLYPEVDLAVMYLDEIFYQHADKDDYIRINTEFKNIGTQIAVLGYPLPVLRFDGDVSKPMTGDILLRTDTGVINCRYRDSQLAYIYEFTVAFNPGNSGGPIFDWRTGQLLSIVRGYRRTPIRQSEHILSEEELKNLKLKEYTEKSFIVADYATYSIGFATPSFIKIFRQHAIVT